MQEIKFKANIDGKSYDVADMEFSYRGNLRRIRLGGESFYRDAKEMAIVQYTGRKDINNVEIYGGDIITPKVMKDSNIDYFGEKLVVKWAKDFAGFGLGRKYDDEMFVCFHLPLDMGNWVKIGNVVENPDLLK